MSLLFRFRPLVISPELAAKIGLNEAIVLQQLKYWINETDSGVDHDGKRWVYNTHEQWAKQFPFWSVDTVKRTLASLQKQGLVLVEKLAKSKHDQTNYYTINYLSDALFDQGNMPSSIQGNLPSSLGAGCPDVLTEITQETTQETTSENFIDPSVVVEQAFELYWKASNKNGSKKKAGSIFASICKRDKLDPMEFAAVLINDTSARKKASQFGFDKLHGTTYLTQERWNDQVPSESSAPKKPSMTKDFSNSTYQSTPDDQFADFLQ